MTTHPTWQQQAPAPPPRKKRHVLRWILIAVGVLFAIGVISSIADSGSSGDKVAPAPGIAAKPQSDHRSDLKSFTLDDRSAYGVDDIWVKWTLTNHSAKVSDYTWDWEAVKADGTRVTNSTEYVTNVQPGQTVKDASPTVLTTIKGIHLNVTHFERVASY